MSDTPTLTAPRIVLRPLVLADAPALFVALSDPQVQLYRRAPAHTNLQETEAYILDTLAKSRAAWAITTDGGEALGRLALRVPESSAGEFGIVIRAAMHRRGFGRRALGLAETFAFSELGLDQLRAEIDAENTPSQALFASAGFVKDSLISAHRITKLGLRDSVIMVKCRPPR